MRKRLSIKGGIFLLAVLSLIAIGVAYAVEIERGISGSAIIGQVETAEETILLYTQVQPTVVPLAELRFDPADISAFGRFKELPRIPFLAQNGGAEPFHLRVELVDVKLNGAPLTDGLSMLMGSAGGGLPPSPDHVSTIQPGELIPLEVGLRFHKSPAELGLDSGDVITFTALFKAAEGPVEQPVTYSQGEAPVPKAGRFVDAIALAEKYGETARYGGTFLNVQFHFNDHNDIHQSSGINAPLLGPIYNSLLMTNPYDYTGNMVDLAYAWELSDDLKQLTFNLHEEVKWHDGVPFTSADVEWSLERIWNKGIRRRS